MNRQDRSFFDRLVDALIDRKHPFWRDERQAAVYHEGSTAAMTLQSLLAPIVGGVCMLIGGKPVIGAVVVMLLVSTFCQQILVGILFRKRVSIDPKAWARGSSRGRKLTIAMVFLFYTGCYLWASGAARFDSTPDGRSLAAVAAALVCGGAVAGGLFALYQKKTAAWANSEDDEL